MNDVAPPKKKRAWVPIVLGILFVCFVLAIGGIFVAYSFFRQNVTVTSMSPGSADGEFDTVRARFAGQLPLIRMVDGRPEFVAERAAREPSSQPLQTMHVLAWDEDEGNLVRVAIPFWLLRLQSGTIRLGAYAEGLDDRGVSFRVEDIERNGPGLVLDFNDPREGRALIWVE